MRINTMWSIYIMECYSAIKKNELLAHAITWMDLKNMLCERCQTQKPT